MLKFLLTHGQGKKTTKSDLHFPSKLYRFFADLTGNPASVASKSRHQFKLAQ